MPKRSPNQLALTDAKKLARLSGRPDQPLAMKTRVFLLERLYERREWLWAQIEAHVYFGKSNAMLENVLDKLLPTQREIATDGAAGAALPQGLSVKIYNVNRGTKQAREQAIAVQAQRRTAATARVIESAT